MVRVRELREGDHTGTHRTFRAGGGRRLDYLLGIAGEVGEGLPFVARPTMASGGRARLLGRGRTWTLAWAEPHPCRSSAIVAAGISRPEFLRLLREARVLA